MASKLETTIIRVTLYLSTHLRIPVRMATDKFLHRDFDFEQKSFQKIVKERSIDYRYKNSSTGWKIVALNKTFDSYQHFLIDECDYVPRKEASLPKTLRNIQCQ